MRQAAAVLVVLLLQACGGTPNPTASGHATAAHPYGEDGILIFLDSNIQDTVFTVGGTKPSATANHVGGIQVGAPGTHVSAVIPPMKLTEARQGLLITARPPGYREKAQWVPGPIVDGWQKTFVFWATDIDPSWHEHNALMNAFPDRTSYPAVALSRIPAIERRVALVIGNKNYFVGADHSGIAPLDKTVRDANLVAGTLRALDFTLVGDGAITDVTKSNFADEIGAFHREARDASVALFYYAGHAVQIDKHNWLLPVDFSEFDRNTYRTDLIDVAEVLAAMDGVSARLKILILDSCRTNPFPGMPRGGAGLASVEKPPLTLVAFATGSGKTAGDGIYAPRLVEAMWGRHLDLPDVFNQAKLAVERSNKDQDPLIDSSIPKTTHFYLNP